MTADDLRAFIVEVRAEADAARARLVTIDADALPADLRERWEQSRRGWEELRQLLEHRDSARGAATIRCTGERFRRCRQIADPHQC